MSHHLSKELTENQGNHKNVFHGYLYKTIYYIEK